MQVCLPSKLFSSRTRTIAKWNCLPSTTTKNHQKNTYTHTWSKSPKGQGWSILIHWKKKKRGNTVCAHKWFHGDLHWKLNTPHLESTASIFTLCCCCCCCCCCCAGWWTLRLQTAGETKRETSLEHTQTRHTLQGTDVTEAKTPCWPKRRHQIEVRGRFRPRNLWRQMSTEV